VLGPARVAAEEVDLDELERQSELAQQDAALEAVRGATWS